MSTEYRKPGVYVEETLLTGASDAGRASTTFLFVGAASKGRSLDPIRCESWADFTTEFGGFDKNAKVPLTLVDGDTTTLVQARNYLPHAVYSFFQNGGRVAYIQRAFAEGTADNIAALDVFGGVENTVLTGTGAPNAGSGQNGDFYVDTTAKAVYGPKTVSGWGASNAALGAGNGAADCLNGSSVPSAGTGADGDFYVRTGANGGTLYGPKDTTWGSATALYDNADTLAFTVQAKSAGTWGNDVSIITTNDNELDADGNNAGIYTLRVLLKGVLVETFSGISLSGDDAGTKRIDETINDPVYGSAYIRIVHETDPGVYVPGVIDPVVPSGTGATNYTQLAVSTLAGGEDPTAPSATEMTEALTAAVGKIDGAVITTVAGYMDPINGYVGADTGAFDETTMNRGDVMFIDDGVQPRTPGQATADYATFLTNGGELGNRFIGNSFVAAYAPWIIVSNPGKRGATITVPPAGAVMGVIARTDATQGVFRAPAGIDAVVVNAVGVETKFGDSDLGTLNSKGVNIIRPVTGRGICVMGARTRKRYSVDRYVSARRTLIYLREALRSGTEFALFENNDEMLWDRLTATADRILRPVWSGGGLRGASAGEAYFVRCDSTINTPAVIASGEVRMDVGVALEYPAEFVVIRLTQFEQGGSNFEVLPAQ
jgi:hypothetical protein